MIEIKQISKNEWNEIADPFIIAIIPMLPGEFSSKFGIQSFEYDEDGLGQCTAFIFDIEGTKYWSRSFLDSDSDARYLNVEVLSTEPNSLLALKKLIKILGFTIEQLPWVNEHIGEASWMLFRLDDNGNEVEMFRFQSELSANWVRKNYEDRGHKQHYIVRRTT